jgi:hypothetical protein
VTSSEDSRAGDQRIAFYWRLAQRWWWTIVVCTALAPIITLTVSLTLIPWSFCAEAAIKPLPAQSGLTDLSMFQHLQTALGQNIAEQAKEYVSILQSFTFAKLVLGHDPAVYGMLFAPGEATRLRSASKAAREWKAYEKISRQLTCYYDNTGGVLRLRYVAHDRETAETMLTIVVNDLIADVRDRDIASYTAQIKSLQDHANHTSDELLRSDIYEIIAKRMEQLTTAEASALTTFRIIEEPYVPLDPYVPRPFLYGLVSAAVTPFVLFGLIVMCEKTRTFVREQSAARTPLSNGFDKSASALKAPADSQDRIDPGP